MTNAFWIEHFWPVAVVCALVFVTGLYPIFVSRNLVRIIIGMELLTKSVTLLLVLAGAVTGRTATMQALIITLIVIEVVAIAVAAGIVIGVVRKNGTVDVHQLTRLKG